MDKCREAFEKLPEIAKRISNGVYFNENLKIYRERKGSCRGATFVNGAWCVWQSRQAEVKSLQEEYAETELYLRGQLTDRDSKIANLEYLLEQDKSLIPILNKKLEEKDKRIKELEKKILNLASMYSTKAAEFNIKDEQKLATVCNEISQILEKALRGEHEA
ncbi:hypothetical protein [Acinetobacter bereziniae]|uniref:hypothetical protein n=1 Tax=Acinetobacter bereziniae TaxID=106648 RepID=UPI00190207CF|nr:hypothetical protein [Acinetobacter bereziniae]MBJ8474364.1 hypothetical protein [Acinetobacter bereziniae]